MVLLLKSSDRVAHDLEQLASRQRCEPLIDATRGDSAAASSSGSRLTASGAPIASASGAATGSSSGSAEAAAAATLCLRKWYDLRPEREFRCD